MKECPFFNTHHAPVGAWASITFGAPGTAMSIELQDPGIKGSGILMAGTAAAGGLQTILFADMPKQSGVSLTAEGSKETMNAKIAQLLGIYNPVPESALSRELTPSRDVFSAGNVSFTTYTPYDALPDPERETIPAEACLPGVLMDVTVDNTVGTAPCTAYLGVMLQDIKKLDAYTERGLCGIRFRNDWAFSARQSDGVFLVRGMDAPRSLMAGKSKVQQNGPAFLCTVVPAGEKKTLTVCWSVYAREGSNGALPTVYYYNRFFRDLLEGAQAILDRADQLRRTAGKVDAALSREGQDESRMALFCQAVRAYYASTQLLTDENGRIRWNVCEGAYLWRNTMDLCADHITWELRRNPWVVRCLMEEFIEDYSYTDTVTFPGLPGQFSGGLSFTHDMGCYFTYAPRGSSGYESVNDSPKGFYFYMTTEELLNGIYCIAGYAIRTGDRDWLARYRLLLPALMESLENRDGPSPQQRNGVLKAASAKGGACGLESTTYDALDHSLLEASGNLYVFIKTWCALLLLKQCCAMLGDSDTAARAEAMLEKCRRSSALFVSSEHPWLKANAYQDIPGAVIAAAEPMAVPHMLGVLDGNTDPILTELLESHCRACLETGVCRDAVSGGLRLSSTSRNTWPSKSVLVIYAMEEVLGLSVPKEIEAEVIGWAQKSARALTIADQIHCDTREVVGAPYYPRIVTASVWL